VFWVNPPVVAACVAGVLAWTRPSPQAQPGRGLDPAGLALATLTLASAVFAVIAAGDSAWPAAAAGALAVTSGAGFVAAERRAAAPLLPPSAFANPEFRAANATAMIMNVTANGTLFLLTRYLQSVLGHSALATGLMLLPLFAPIAVLSPAAGRLAARYGPRPPMIAGAALAAAGMLGLLLVTPAATYPRVLPALAGIGMGFGMFTAPVVTAAIRALPPDRSGLASGINNTVRQADTALGVAVFGVIAGSPADPGHFVTALHALGVASALLWLAVIGITLAGIRRPGVPAAGVGDGTRNQTLTHDMIQLANWTTAAGRSLQDEDRRLRYWLRRQRHRARARRPRARGHRGVPVRENGPARAGQLGHRERSRPGVPRVGDRQRGRRRVRPARRQPRRRPGRGRHRPAAGRAGQRRPPRGRRRRLDHAQGRGRAPRRRHPRVPRQVRTAHRRPPAGA
jgi:hypothetical protein